MGFFKRIFLICFITATFVFISADSEAKKIPRRLIKAGEFISGTAVEQKAGKIIDFERVEKWEKGELKRSSGELKRADILGKKFLADLREKFDPTSWTITNIKGEVYINDFPPRIGQKIEAKKDLITLRGSRIELESPSGGVKVTIEQDPDFPQRSDFTFGDMSSMETMTVYVVKHSPAVTEVESTLSSVSPRVAPYRGKVEDSRGITEQLGYIRPKMPPEEGAYAREILRLASKVLPPDVEREVENLVSEAPPERVKGVLQNIEEILSTEVPEEAIEEIEELMKTTTLSEKESPQEKRESPQKGEEGEEQEEPEVSLPPEEKTGPHPSS